MKGTRIKIVYTFVIIYAGILMFYNNNASLNPQKDNAKQK